MLTLHKFFDFIKISAGHSPSQVHFLEWTKEERRKARIYSLGCSQLHEPIVAHGASPGVMSSEVDGLLGHFFFCASHSLVAQAVFRLIM